MSSSIKEKSNNWKFPMIRSFVTDFGITTTPRWIWYRRRICAAVFLYFLAIAEIVGSSVNWGSPSDWIKKNFFTSKTSENLNFRHGNSPFFSHGLAGLPNGEYAINKMFLASQCCFNFAWFKKGWHSTWFATGRILADKIKLKSIF